VGTIGAVAVDRLAVVAVGALTVGALAVVGAVGALTIGILAVPPTSYHWIART
jgi:hypothetical protein